MPDDQSDDSDAAVRAEKQLQENRVAIASFIRDVFGGLPPMKEPTGLVLGRAVKAELVKVTTLYGGDVLVAEAAISSRLSPSTPDRLIGSKVLLQLRDAEASDAETIHAMGTILLRSLADWPSN